LAGRQASHGTPELSDRDIWIGKMTDFLSDLPHKIIIWEKEDSVGTQSPAQFAGHKWLIGLWGF
jgi:hypothetical protein